MSGPYSERRLAENEVVLRDLNSRVKKGFDKINRAAQEAGSVPEDIERDVPLHFYCECSDENCRQRVLISPRAYDRIHTDLSKFTLVRGHEVVEVERVVEREPEYCVVVKHEKPPESASGLNATNVDNV